MSLNLHLLMSVLFKQSLCPENDLFHAELTRSISDKKRHLSEGNSARINISHSARNQALAEQLNTASIRADISIIPV